MPTQHPHHVFNARIWEYTPENDRPLLIFDELHSTFDQAQIATENHLFDAMPTLRALHWRHEHQHSVVDVHNPQATLYQAMVYQKEIL